MTDMMISSMDRARGSVKFMQGFPRSSLVPLEIWIVFIFTHQLKNGEKKKYISHFRDVVITMPNIREKREV